MLRIKCLIFFTFFLLLGRIEAADIHAFVVCDSNDTAIGKTLNIDIQSIKKQLNTVKSKTGIDVKWHTFIGDDALPDDVLDALESLEVDEDDVIFFFFGGHGFSLDGKDDGYPHLYFGNTQQGCDFYTLTQQLVEKEPRLLISLSDCCNNLIPDKYAPEIINHRSLYWWGPPLDERYSKLFLETTGIFIGTGATQGEFAICDRKNGGYFTHSFCESIADETYENSQPEWENVIARLVDKVSEMTYQKQNPSCLFIPERPSKNINIQDYYNEVIK